MNSSELEALKLIMNGSFSIRELASKLGLSYSRTATILRGLIKEGYCERYEGRIGLARNVKTSLLKELALRYDISLLLGGTGEKLLLALNEASSVPEIQRRTGLAQSTVYQKMRELMAVGAIRKINGRYVMAEEPSLKAFLETLKRERESFEIEPQAVLLYSRHGVKIKRVPTGQVVEGSKTAFSLFPKYGLDYFSPYDYYVEPGMEVSIEECLIHALMVGENKTERTMCALFYLKNVEKIDMARARALVKKYGVFPLWTELQNYVKGLPYNQENFLPWDEFREKASLYGVTVSPPPGYETIVRMLTRLGEESDKPVSAYLFDGASLLLRGLKNATKDLDLVVDNTGDFSKLREALLKLGFRTLAEYEMTATDRKLNPTGIFVAPGLPRFDLFTKTICNAFSLTRRMKKRAETRVFGRLELRLLSLEDVFLLKSITEREGDLEDMAIIARHGGGLKWNIILETYFEEERKIRRHLCFVMLDSIEFLQERENLIIPIYAPLLRHCIDVGILQSVHRGATSVKEIRGMIDFPEHMIRNRIARLAKEGKILKFVKKRRLFLKLTTKGRGALFT